MLRWERSPGRHRASVKVLSSGPLASLRVHGRAHRSRLSLRRSGQALVPLTLFQDYVTPHGRPPKPVRPPRRARPSRPGLLGRRGLGAPGGGRRPGPRGGPVPGGHRTERIVSRGPVPERGRAGPSIRRSAARDRYPRAGRSPLSEQLHRALLLLQVRAVDPAGAGGGERGFDTVIDGTNADDLGEHRPGLRAAASRRYVRRWPSWDGPRRRARGRSGAGPARPGMRRPRPACPAGCCTA